MAGAVKNIETDADFQPELTNAGAKLVVVDFYAVWCGPCQRIAPKFELLSSKYPNALFLKVDVDKCPDVAQSNGVSAMPTFLFFRNCTKVDSMRGADENALEEKIKKWYGTDEEEGAPVKGHMDLSSFITKAGCECLNEDDEHPLGHALSSKGGYLQSDCDEQLIISLQFSQKMKLHSMKLTGPADKGAKTVKIFINQPASLDFDKAEGMTAVQEFVLTPEDIEPGAIIPLRYVKFQNIDNVTIFVKDNQEGGEVTQIDHLALFGSPMNTTNMTEFKRVAGKKGESH